ncbi:uncharacterized protein DEA37_0006935 [Paragonimus westermani]|uniref:Uncharacterized protein n=1 Tax=Paragonimus westermani TaxID=34504 RepID=A0A5J4NXG8_9TREM|nr:uncharacterized protein DEA37_0006935 [Paragonimus westermani]
MFGRTVSVTTVNKRNTFLYSSLICITFWIIVCSCCDLWQAVIVSSAHELETSNEYFPFWTGLVTKLWATPWFSWYTLLRTKIPTLQIIPGADARGMWADFPDPPSAFRDERHMEAYFRALNYYYQVMGRSR